MIFEYTSVMKAYYRKNCIFYQPYESAIVIISAYRFKRFLRIYKLPHLETMLYIKHFFGTARLRENYCAG